MPILASWMTWGLVAFGFLIGVAVGSWLTERYVWREREWMERIWGALKDRGAE